MEPPTIYLPEHAIDGVRQLLQAFSQAPAENERVTVLRGAGPSFCAGRDISQGMKVDIEDRVFCNGPGGVHVFGRDGNCLGVMKTPEKSTNFCFGGADRSTLFITASTSLYRIATKTSGAPMIPGR